MQRLSLLSSRVGALCLTLVVMAGCGGGDSAQSPTTTVPPPPTVPPPSTAPGFEFVSAGREHTCGFRGSNYQTATCWGENSAGQLGNGTTTDTSSPGLSWVVGLEGLTEGTGVPTAGGSHSCGYGYRLGNPLRFIAHCWGDNSSGQLGNGTTANSTSAVPVAAAANGDFIDGGGFGGVVATGGSHSCGASRSGWLCWGANGSGQLGNGTTTDSAIPVAIGGGLGLGQLTAGANHTCGITATATGTAYCWGSNASGQLGNATTANSALPLAVAGGLAFALLSAGDSFTCGVTTTGAAYCWGSNASGQLGNGSTTNSAVPVAVGGGLAFAALSAGGDHACGVTTTGAAYCWGSNAIGQLGDGTTTNRPTPAAVIDGLSFAIVSAGGQHSCGSTTGRVAYCWGGNSSGQLGNGTTTMSTVPVKVANQP